jgi:DNA-binding CsgD family transcriptional regulator
MPVYAGTEYVKDLGEAWYRLAAPPVDTYLILDEPWGFAICRFGSGLPRPAVIATGSDSPHYLFDLRELEPDALLASLVTRDDIIDAVKRVARGEHIYKGPKLAKGSLTPHERIVHRLVAFGLTNSQIATRLHLAEGTVANTVCTLRSKLGLTERVHLSLCYFGILQYIPEFSSNPPVECCHLN